MKHKIIAQHQSIHPYEVVTIELIPQTKEQSELLKNLDKQIMDHMTLKLNVVEIIENSNPRFKVKIIKSNLGLGR
jgi:hypothetical protein